MIRIDDWTRLKSGSDELRLREVRIDGRVTLHYSTVTVSTTRVLSDDYEGSKVRIEGKLTVTHFPALEQRLLNGCDMNSEATGVTCYSHPVLTYKVSV